ncbi:PREDICTED: DNA repair endonuclease XPF isoform X1 [Polistes dominula]|uniref:DNA repair endonuclease XPF isoform X1 n=2 Tax=Polistes dominula TaxID=743375 RepID=A0ABM1J2E1_POLDO|nr:PREDICTED: DNA repair endonuclease XPF isoform X1 [Polistes dominula]
MLEYENEMLLEVLQEDGLVITAKGLGIETVFVNLLKVYLDPGNLVIVLGTLETDEKYFIDELKSLGTKTLPRIVTGQCTSSEREQLYLDGGILFIPGRILVVDLLKNRVPLHLVTGILVYRAHNILRSYQEAFAVRLYRQINKTGFIKAFSNSALSFTFGFSNVERVMKTLFIKRLYLWPRFHTIVNNSLSKRKPEVLEFHVKITYKMLHIQTALLDAMNYVVKELKRINKYLDLEELTVENAIAKKFHKQLQSQLDPVWHQLSSTSKQLLSDLKTLRGLLMSLTYKDCVSFYSTLKRLRTMEYAMKSSGWLMLDAVENLFKFAKDRVYTEKNELKPEPSPKWIALTEVLLEIQRNKNKEDPDDDSPEKILILVQDSQTCYQLKNYLTIGANEYLLNEAHRKLRNDNLSKSNNTPDNDDKSITTESENDEEILDTQDSYILTLTQKTATESQSIAQKNEDEDEDENEHHQTLFEDCSQMNELDLTAIATTAPILIVQSLKKDGDPMAVQRTLKEAKPSNIIMYVADIAVIRQLEIYQNSNPSINVKVYFLIYEGSVEEQEYLTSLRREKESFHILINNKKTMVIPEDQDGKSEDCLKFATQLDNETELNSRKGDQEQEQKHVVNKIIVDMREFQSELPSILHSRGIQIEPVTLTIGDYILSPEICIERKSVSDLIGSLNSGRLYNQAVAMSRYYSKPMLLIEFDQNKPFCFQGCYYMGKDVNSFAVTSKLQLLTLHFPKLKLVWSQSPHASAQLFEELKSGRDQPSAEKAATIGVDENTEDSQLMVQKYNPHIQDFISKLPGVHSKNLCAILNKGKSLDHLIKLTEDELAEIVGNKSDAEMLYNSIHKKCDTNEETNVKGTGVKKVPKGRGKKLFSKIKQ